MVDQDNKLEMLRRLVKESPLQKAEIARIAQINPNSLSRILKGTNRLHDVETIEGLAKALNVHPGIFFGDFDLDHVIQNDVINLPLVIGLHNIDDPLKRRDTEMIPTPKSMLIDVDLETSNPFWVQALGNALAPRLRHNDQVLVALTPLKNGDLVVSYDTINKIIMLKRYMDYGTKVTLIPENPDDRDFIEITHEQIGSAIKLYKVIRIAQLP